jgi:hypothetical protein
MLDFAYCVFDAIEAFRNRAIQNLAAFRQLDAAAHAFEQAHADMVLHAREHTAHGRLAHIEFLRGACEVAAAGGRFEHEQRIGTREFLAKAWHDDA